MSIFKRIFGDREDTSNSHVQVFKSPPNANVKSMGQSLQKKFSRGVQYNMKILVRGDRNVGKSALLARLRGMDFVEQYIPTDEIEVACIHWSYQGCEDVVKVDVWDVVDKGRRKKSGTLKLDNSHHQDNSDSGGSGSGLCLDAGFMDVYKGAHGVIMMLDMTKSWTLQYVERELPLVPPEVPVLVLANHRDMGHHRTVSTDQVTGLVEQLRPQAHYWESSMKNGYGLLYIHRFLSLPFLRLQRLSLLGQLATNEAEAKGAQGQLLRLQDEPDSVYDTFLQALKSGSSYKNNATQVAQKSAPSSLSLRSAPPSQISSPVDTHQSSPRVPATPSATGKAPVHVPQARPIPGMERLGLYPLPVPSGDVTADQKPTPIIPVGIHDFVPDEPPELDSFLGEDGAQTPHLPPQQQHQHQLLHNTNRQRSRTESSHSSQSSSDGQHQSFGDGPCRQNPMVAAFNDDLDDFTTPTLLVCSVPEEDDEEDDDENFKSSSMVKKYDDEGPCISSKTSRLAMVSSQSPPLVSTLAAVSAPAVAAVLDTDDVVPVELKEEAQKLRRKKKKAHKQKSEGAAEPGKKRRSSRREVAAMENGEEKQHKRDGEEKEALAEASDSLERFLNE